MPKKYLPIKAKLSGVMANADLHVIIDGDQFSQPHTWTKDIRWIPQQDGSDRGLHVYGFNPVGTMGCGFYIVGASWNPQALASIHHTGHKIATGAPIALYRRNGAPDDTFSIVINVLWAGKYVNEPPIDEIRMGNALYMYLDMIVSAVAKAKSWVHDRRKMRITVNIAAPMSEARCRDVVNHTSGGVLLTGMRSAIPPEPPVPVHGPNGNVRFVFENNGVPEQPSYHWNFKFRSDLDIVSINIYRTGEKIVEMYNKPDMEYCRMVVNALDKIHQGSCDCACCKK